MTKQGPQEARRLPDQVSGPLLYSYLQGIARAMTDGAVLINSTTTTFSRASVISVLKAQNIHESDIAEAITYCLDNDLLIEEHDGFHMTTFGLTSTRPKRRL